MSTHPQRPAPTDLGDPVVRHAHQDYARILVHDTVGESLAAVQRSGLHGRVAYFYVVDEENRLRGVVPTRGLLLNPPESRVADLMVRNLITLPADATLLDACELFVMHRLLALPVVDREGRLLGVVDIELYTDEIVDLTEREVANDVFQLIGVRLAEVERASVPVIFRRRFPWLLCNIGGGLICAFLAGAFEGTLQRAIALALFIPVVLAVAESVSIQSLTLTLQAQHGARVPWRRVLRALGTEAPVGVLLGLASGGLISAVAWLWLGQGGVAVCILLALAMAITAAAILGISVPAVLWSLQRDPKLASGPIVLALTDVTTLLLYLGLATWLLP